MKFGMVLCKTSVWYAVYHYKHWLRSRQAGKYSIYVFYFTIAVGLYSKTDDCLFQKVCKKSRNVATFFQNVATLRQKVVNIWQNVARFFQNIPKFQNKVGRFWQNACIFQKKVASLFQNHEVFSK